MSLLQNSNAIPQLGGYNLTDSLRFRASADTYLSRTNSSAATLATKATISLWVKRCRNGSVRDYIIQTGTGTGNNNYFSLFFTTSGPDSLKVGQYSVNAYVNDITRYRDPSAWYHLVCAFDSTLGTAADRCKIWINGELTTNVSGAAGASSNCALTNNGQTVYIGREAGYPSDVYMTEFHLIDGQALTASDFGEYDNTTGVWKPKAYTGTYGNNGWYLDMSTSGSTVTDKSGNGNNWTATNMNLTTSTDTTYDKMSDVPTLTDEDTANYPTINPLNQDGTHSSAFQGNLEMYSASSSWGAAGATMEIPSSGKWYWETTNGVSSTSLYYGQFGIWETTGISNIKDGFARYVGTSDTYGKSYAYATHNGKKYTNGSSATFAAAATAVGDVIGIAFDADAGTLSFYKNGSLLGTAFTGLTSRYVPAFSCNGDTGGTFSYYVNFGQRPFAYTPPTGYLKLNTYNLSDSTIVDGSQHFDVKLDTGANIKSTSEAVYTNQLEWIKDRANANNHQLIDSVRGLTAVLQCNSTGTETTYSAPSGSSVGWIWRASDSTAVTNNDGTITSTVSANTTSGFSIVTHTSTGTTGTVGHGLGVTPKIVIEKTRSMVESWLVQTSIIDGTHDYLWLDLTSAKANMPWGSLPTNQVFSSYGHAAGTTKVAYCFAEVEGYSKIGSYTGNGSTDGPFVYTGFRPKYVIIKNATNISGGGNWCIKDSVRGTYNANEPNLIANNSDVEYNERAIDFLSNGFKIRDSNGNVNYSGATLIYMAFAENPFKNSLAR